MFQPMIPVHQVAYPDLNVASVLSFPFPIPALLTLRAAGEMGASGGEINSVRRDFLAKVAVSRDRFVSLHQIHSRSVLAADPETYGSDADGMVTSDRRLCIGVTVADCMPIYLFDRSSGAFGILHSGWRGTGILADAVRMMARLYETEAAELTVLLGPAIGVCCYRVDEERAALFRGRWGNRSAVQRDGQWYLDLRRANLDLADRLGVGVVIDGHICTACHDAFSSFRREGPDSYAGMLALTGRLIPPAEAIKVREIQ